MSSIKQRADGRHCPGLISFLSLIRFKFMYSVLNRRPVAIALDNIELMGDLSIPDQAYAMVLFAHGSGSSRLSPRNQMVADYLNKEGIATFLFDLLTTGEDMDYANRFNVRLLAHRLKRVTKWIMEQPECESLKVGYFGASTGAAAALIAAMDLPRVDAIVSRGGRPDLAIHALPHIKAATLFIVGSLDTEVLRLNRKAFDYLDCNKKIEIVPGATHLFEEKGAMQQVCVLAANWFQMHMEPGKL
jgi:dienelactone hydrolase